MIGRRYPEGGIAPVLQFPNRRNSYTEQEALRKKRRTKWLVPVDELTLSTTSDARDCFVKRENSKIFQQFALNYAYNVVTAMVLSGEI